MKILSFDELITEKVVTSSKTIEDALKRGFVKFVYFKLSGEKRIAYGTLKPNFLKMHANFTRTSSNPKAGNGVAAAKAMGYIVYFDFIRGNFRMFTVSRRTKIINEFKSINDVIRKYPKLKTRLLKYT